jgi:hypothetical protein
MAIASSQDDLALGVVFERVAVADDGVECRATPTAYAA